MLSELDGAQIVILGRAGRRLVQIPTLHFRGHFGEDEAPVCVFQFVIRRHVARVSEFSNEDEAVGSNGEPSDGAVVKRHPQPRFRRKLKRSTNEVTDHVGVGHDHLIRIALLFFLKEVVR